MVATQVGVGGGGVIAYVGSVPPTTAGAAAGPAADVRPVVIGIGFDSQSSTGAQQTGVTGATASHSVRDVYGALVDDVDRRGGLGGRPLVAEYFDYSAVGDSASQDAAACAAYTRAHAKFVVVTDDGLADCAESAAAVGVTQAGGTAGGYQRHPHLLSPDGIRLDRLGAVTTAGLARQGFFSGKLGVVTWDDSLFRDAYQRGYLPALAARNVTPADVAYIARPSPPGGSSAAISTLAMSVSRFHMEGIDDVVIQDGPDATLGMNGLTVGWMRDATAEMWHPRYGLNDANVPGSALLPPDEMNHAVVITQVDADPANDQGWQTNPARDRCYAIEAAAGLSVTNAPDETAAADACDTIGLIQQVVSDLADLGPLDGSDAFVHAAEQLGPKFQPAAVFGDRLLPGRPDGGDQVRPQTYLSSCRCLQYTGPPFRSDG